MYPVSDRALLPAPLDRVLGAVGQIGLVLLGPDNEVVTPADLGKEAWRRFTPVAIASLTKQIRHEVSLSYRAIQASDIPIDVRVELAGLELKTRTRNCVLLGGLVVDGWLRPTTLGEIARISNLGAASLLDFLAALPEGWSEDQAQAEGSQEECGADTPLLAAVERLRHMAWAQVITRRDPRVGPALALLEASAPNPAAAAELIAKRRHSEDQLSRQVTTIENFIAVVDATQALPLERELRDIVEAVQPKAPSRTIEALILRLGLGGEDPRTLEVTAHALTPRLTRERVRQLERKFRERVSGRPVWAPVLDRVLARAHELLPESQAVLVETLWDEGLTEGPFGPKSLLSAAELLGRPAPFAIVPGMARLIGTSQEPNAVRTRSLARRLGEHWGVTTTEEVLARLSAEGSPMELSDVVHILDAVDGVEWLGPEIHRWFWIRDGARNRLLNTILKIMSVAGSINIGELRAGVGRHHRMEGFRPPRTILAALCEASGQYTVRGDRVYGHSDLPTWEDTLGHIERTLVEILFDQQRPIMRRDDLEEEAAARGINRNSLFIYLTYSPVLVRLAPWVWGLRGADVSAAEVDALVPDTPRRRVLQDTGWTTDGRIWMAFRMSPASIQSGVLGVPAPVRRITKGRFALLSRDGAPVGNLVLGQQMWGISSFIARWGVEPGDILVVVLAPGKRSAIIEAGDDDLLLRYQSGETGQLPDDPETEDED